MEQRSNGYKNDQLIFGFHKGFLKEFCGYIYIYISPQKMYIK